MSRYTFKGKEAYWKVVVGWDNPLETFFAQVLDERDECPEEEGLLLWVGTTVEEVTAVESLAAAVEPYGKIPEDVWEALRRDRAARTPPSPAQRELRKLFS